MSIRSVLGLVLHSLRSCLDCFIAAVLICKCKIIIQKAIRRHPLEDGEQMNGFIFSDKWFTSNILKCNHFGFSCNKMRKDVTVQLCRSYNMNYFLGCCGLGDIIHPKSRWPHLFLTFMTPWFHIWLENDLLLEQHGSSGRHSVSQIMMGWAGRRGRENTGGRESPEKFKMQIFAEYQNQCVSLDLWLLAFKILSLFLVHHLEIPLQYLIWLIRKIRGGDLHIHPSI